MPAPEFKKTDRGAACSCGWQIPDADMLTTVLAVADHVRSCPPKKGLLSWPMRISS